MFDFIKRKFLFRRLNNCIPEDIPRFSFEGITTYARVVNVYDGDTIIIIFEYKGEMIKYSCRIYGIDTPEIRTRDDEEKKRGYEARDFLRSFIQDKIIKIDLLKFDKYGRLLGLVYANINGSYINVNNLMIKNNYAKPYFGGTK